MSARENACTRIGERFTAAFAARDWAGVASLLAVDVEIEDRRLGLRNVIRGRDAAISNLRELAAVAGSAWSDEEVVATRGDRIALIRRKLPGPGGSSFEMEILDLFGLDAEHRVAFGIHFESDDREQALAAMNALDESEI